MSTTQPGPPAQPDGPQQPAQQAATGHAPVPPPRPLAAVARREPGPFKRGFGLGAGAGIGFGAAVLALSTVLSVLTGLIFVAGLAAAAGGTAETTSTVWGQAGAPKTLRAIDVKGAILTDVDGGALLSAGTYGYEIAQQIDDLDANDADGLILRMDTPGGTVTGAKAIADAVDRYKARTKKKVFAHVQGMSASGGMYAMAGADNIQADYGSFVGSIGVVMGPLSRYRDVVAIDGGLLSGGVTTTGGIDEYYLTQGRGKDAGNPYRDLTDEERSVFMNGLANEYTAFVDHVSAKRGIPAEVIRNDIGALIYDNVTAKEKKLIDGTMGIDEAYRYFATSAGLDPEHTKVVAAASPSPWQTLLGAEARVPGQAMAIKSVPGARPVTAAAMCGPARTILAYHGTTERDCG